MAKFNSKVYSGPNTFSYEGGAVYTKTPVEDWLNFLFSSYMENRFYESAQTQQQRFHNLTLEMIHTYGPEFVGKAAIFARNELGMRSASQYVAAMLNNYQFEGKRSFFFTFCHRPDDVAEIFGAIDLMGDKRSHALIRGCADYLSTLSSYGIGKYKLNNHTYNMYDLINITHANSEAINAYKQDTLEVPDTWEVAISTADNANKRNQEWKRLVEQKKLGYMALLRNLRNILNVPDIDQQWIDNYLYPLLIDEVKIRSSLIFPYQIYSAYKNMGIKNFRVILGLHQAFMISLENMPKLDGKTLVMLDVSGSMDCPISRNSSITIREAGAVYAICILLTGEDSDFIKFGTYAKYHSPQKLNNIFDEIEHMQANDSLGYGTDISAAYQVVKDNSYDRIILISDMQIMQRYRYSGSRADGVSNYEEYCRKYRPIPIYSFDLGNYSTQTSNPNNPNVYLCTSLSEKTLKMISLLENGENLISYINDNYSYL